MQVLVRKEREYKMSKIIRLDDKNYDKPENAGFYYFIAEKTRTEEDKELDTYEVMRKQMLERGICESDVELSIATIKRLRGEK